MSYGLQEELNTSKPKASRNYREVDYGLDQEVNSPLNLPTHKEDFRNGIYEATVGRQALRNDEQKRDQVPRPTNREEYALKPHAKEVESQLQSIERNDSDLSNTARQQIAVMRDRQGERLAADQQELKARQLYQVAVVGPGEASRSKVNPQEHLQPGGEQLHMEQQHDALQEVDEQQQQQQQSAIDINRLPRFGLLAPEQLPGVKRAEHFIYYNTETKSVYRSRGLLRERMEKHEEGAPLRQWEAFTARQEQRYAPIPPDHFRRTLAESKGYRLRILRVNDLPVAMTADGRTFEFKLGVSLYDEAYGTFYGNTVYSLPDTYDRTRAAQRNAVDLDFSFDVYFHSSISDPRCMAVLEVIMVERGLDGVIRGEYALGWALLPLYRVTMPPPFATEPQDVRLDPVPGKPFSVPLVAGTPRYLLFRNVYNEDLRPPRVIPNCSILFQAEGYPAMDAVIPLLPENYLVSYADVIPGLRRFDTEGRLSITSKTVISTLAAPILCPTFSIVLRRLQVALPIQVHELLTNMVYKVPPMPVSAALDPPSEHPEPDPGLKYLVRISVHNGRTFVGPVYELHELITLDVPGWRVLQAPSPPDPVFDYAMADVMVVVVVELLAKPAQVSTSSAPPPYFCLGWSSFSPFEYISGDGAQAEVKVGIHRYPLDGLSGRVALRNQPMLKWRTLLGDSAARTIKTPMVEFQLFETGRQPIPPPLRRDFPVFDEVREDAPSEEHEMLPLPPTHFQEPGGPWDTAYVDQDQHPLPPLEQGPISPVLPGSPVGEMHYGGPVIPDELRELTGAMQRQLELLTRAVEDLREERKSLRNSMAAFPGLTGLADNDELRDQAAETIQDYYNQYRQRKSGLHPTPEELQRFRDMAPTSEFGDPAAFSGAAMMDGGKPQGAAPSRVVMQQLYDAGIVAGLPEDVQALLRRRPPPRGPSTMPVDLGIESRDPRTTSDIIMQVLAYRSHETLNAPTNLTSLYFTHQFFHFPPTTTEMAYMVAASTDDPSTQLLMSSSPLRKGAGLLLKYTVDGTAQPFALGEDPQQAAFSMHMAFCTYLAHKSLSIDVWDGESKLQVGTAVCDLVQLLRQGREFAELLTEVPIMDPPGTASSTRGRDFSAAPVTGTSGVTAAGPTILSKGSVLLRFINIGKQPESMPKISDFDAARYEPGKRIRRRVKPAWEEPQSPILAYLTREAGWAGSLPLKSVAASANGRLMGAYNEDPPRSVRASARASNAGGLTPSSQQMSIREMEDMKLQILDHEHRKSVRLVQYKALSDLDKRVGEELRISERDLAPPRDASQYRKVQEVLLADVSAARSRGRDEFIRAQLRRNMVQHRVVKPAFGEVVVYEHELVNASHEEQSYEIRISAPSEVRLLTRMDEYRALRAANARFYGNPAQPVGHLEQELGQGNRVFLQPGERITLPFRIQSMQPPLGHTSTPGVTQLGPGTMGAPSPQPAAGIYASAGAAASRMRSVDGAQLHSDVRQTRDVGVKSAADMGHVVLVEMVSLASGHPVSVLELHIAPQPLIIDRTFRFYNGERELMRQVIKLMDLPGAAVTYAGGRLRSLVVTSNHPEVVVGAGTSGLSGGPERDELYIKHKCGPAPEVVQFHVLLYLDRLMARPVEVWQVYVHALKKVDMKALIGQTSQASVVIRGARVSRRVSCYTSHPDELQVSPDSLVLVAGALTEVVLHFRPVAAGMTDMKVHLVDAESRELVYALIVAAEASGPLVSRTFEVEMPAGTVAHKKITYTNPYQQYRTFLLRSNQPWLVTFTPTRLQMPAGVTRPVGLTFDGRAATVGMLDVLVFVNDEDDKTEECFKIRVRLYK